MGRRKIKGKVVRIKTKEADEDWEEWRFCDEDERQLERNGFLWVANHIERYEHWDDEEVDRFGRIWTCKSFATGKEFFWGEKQFEEMKDE